MQQGKEKLPKLQAQILKNDFVVLEKIKPKTKLNQCPSCKMGELITILVFDSRGPPKEYVKYLESQKHKNLK